MNHKLLGVNVMQPAHHLLEQVFGVVFFQLAPLADVAEQVSALAEFHHEAHMLVRLE